ncbi:MAG: tRNA (adenosine(37)-N6)-threonylcarbamoyltransferase complex transferase subunit TsaD [Deltaproteobacteria bacterium]|nr:tRNA (adenosine(37)-N6)-threonylcarbamoyltransferase complex transferase subunit TsaD [Deltaproteobacteria bacterium]
MRILAIESSCDDTSAAVVDDGRVVLSCVVSSQDAFHAKYGGVVPELASRRHLEMIGPVVDEALQRADTSLNEIDAVAATNGPGLIGSLLVGLNFAKSLAFARGLPFAAVNHIEGHLFAARLGDKAPAPPFVGLVVSGGHTDLYRVEVDYRPRLLGRTRDDAAGECFDKVAKMLGLGFPGGVVIDKLSRDGDPNGVELPRPMLHSGDDAFSFSGLKTAVKTHVETHGEPEGKALNDLAASLSAAIVDVLCAKLFAAAERERVSQVVVCGGVAANSMLRARVTQEAERRGMELFIPAIAFCTDNAAMIGAAGQALLDRQGPSPLSVNAFASLVKGIAP